MEQGVKCGVGEKEKEGGQHDLRCPPKRLPPKVSKYHEQHFSGEIRDGGCKRCHRVLFISVVGLDQPITSVQKKDQVSHSDTNLQVDSPTQSLVLRCHKQGS